MGRTIAMLDATKCRAIFIIVSYCKDSVNSSKHYNNNGDTFGELCFSPGRLYSKEICNDQIMIFC